MKKFLVALLALAMMFALAVPVFAEASEVSVPSDTKYDITADYQEGTKNDKVETVYLVTVDWATTSTLTYSDGTTTYTWNANSTQYEAQTPEGAGWTGDAQVTITVTNKSNAAITAAASWDDADEITAECDFGENENIEVASAAQNTSIAEDKLTGSPVTGTINATVTVSEGTIDESDAKVGTITLSISAVTD